MEIEKIFTCDHCLRDSVYAKVWIKWKIFFLCEECFDKEEEKEDE